MGKELVSWTRYLEVAPKRDSSKSGILVRINALAFLTGQAYQECVVEQFRFYNDTPSNTFIKTGDLLCLTLLNNYYYS